MAAVKMICRVCGKEYAACLNVKTAPGVFRWQEMCCSPECGDVYLSRVIASRTPKTEEPVTASRTNAKRSRKKTAEKQEPVPEESPDETPAE